MADYKHDHPGQKEPRAHSETHHENRIVDLNTAPEEELADLPMVGPKRARDLMQHRPFKVVGRRSERARFRQRHDR